MSVIMKPRGSTNTSAKRLGESFDPMANLLANSSLVRSKRRPKLMAGGIGVLVAGALAGALTISRGTEQRTAIVASSDIGVGEVITASQLRVVRIARDTDVRSLPANAANQLINGVAAVPISKGALLLPESVNRTQTAPDGTVLIGMVLEPGALPSPDLRFGDKVRVLIASPSGSVDDPSKIATEAIVWRIWGSQTAGGSRRAVTLAVPDAASVAVGEAAARNSIRLLVVPNDRAHDAPGWPSNVDTPSVPAAAAAVSVPATSGDPVAASVAPPAQAVQP